MAKLDLSLNKEIKLGSSKSRIKRPTKTSINLVIKKESKLNLPMMIGVIVLALLLVVLLVIMPIVKLTSETSRVSRLTDELTEANTVIASYGDVEKEYAHYTTAGMSSEELERIDRVRVMKLVEDAVVNSGAVNSWNIDGNTMVLQVHGGNLAELNQIAAALERDPIVERCVINTANRANSSNANGVTVSFVVYLTQDDGSQAETSDSDSADADADNAGDESGEEEQDQ